MLWKTKDCHFTTKSFKSPNVGHYRGNHIVLEPCFEYDLKVIIPLFITCFETLNPTIETCASFGHGDELKDEGNMFRGGASFEESF